MLGVSDEDLVIDGFLDLKDVQQIIIHEWRDASFDADAAAWAVPTLLSLRWAAEQYESPESAPILEWLKKSPLRDRMLPLTAQWDTPADFHRDLTAASASIGMPDSLDALGTLVQRSNPGRNILFWFTPLEARLLGSDPERDEARTVLERARLDKFAWLTAPGSWPTEHKGTSPPWLRDIVTAEGARMWRSRSGYVSTWSVVVETDQDERDLYAWTYNPVLAVEFPNDSSVKFYIVLDAESNNRAYLPFHYSYEDYNSAVELDTLLTVCLVRIEAYRLDSTGELQHLWNFGIPIHLSERVQPHRSAWEGAVRDRFDLTATPQEIFKAIDQRQSSVFEHLLPTFDTRSAEPGVRAAWDRHLAILEHSAVTYATGGLVDDRLLKESASELRSAEAAVRRVTYSPSDDWIRSGEALLHIGLREDSGWFSTLIVFRTRDGVLHGLHNPIDSFVVETGDSVGSWSSFLFDVMKPLGKILNLGVSHLIVSSGLGTYELPLHDAALRLGFESSIYAHSVRSPRSRRDEEVTSHALVLGHPGEGTDYIAAADAELDAVANLTGSVRSKTGWRADWPFTVHVAGHGIAGEREYQTGIALANGDFMSSAGILNGVDAQATDLAFLSACSSGTGRFEVGRAAHAIPLDVALLEKGCRTVISTAAPVNDHVALVFAIAFHTARNAGATNWDSYTAARRCFSRDRISAPKEAETVLDIVYPRWRTPLQEADREDWKLFRFSGER